MKNVSCFFDSQTSLYRAANSLVMLTLKEFSADQNVTVMPGRVLRGFYTRFSNLECLYLLHPRVSVAFASVLMTFRVSTFNICFGDITCL